MLINSKGFIPLAILDALKSISRWRLVMAIAAFGMKASLKAMAAVGWRSITLIVAETVFRHQAPFVTAVSWSSVPATADGTLLSGSFCHRIGHLSAAPCPAATHLCA